MAENQAVIFERTGARYGVHILQVREAKIFIKQ